MVLAMTPVEVLLVVLVMTETYVFFDIQPAEPSLKMMDEETKYLGCWKK